MIFRFRKTVRQLLVVTSVLFGHSVLTLAPAKAATDSPHQHGAGALNVVVDGSDLALEVRLPAIDIVGFEHEPRNEEQTAQVEKALASFIDGRTWFEPSSSAACILETAHASMVGRSVEFKPGPSEGKSSHESKHDHERERHQHEDKHGDEDLHSDFEGDLEFHCDSPRELNQLKVLLFTVFPGVKALDVQVVTPAMQTKRALSAEQSVLSLSR